MNVSHWLDNPGVKEKMRGLPRTLLACGVFLCSSLAAAGVLTTGRPLVMNEIPDVFFSPSNQAQKIVTVNYTQDTHISQSNNGLYARSNLSGVSVVAAYAANGNQIGDIVPSGSWAPIASSAYVSPPIQSNRAGFSRFMLAFDGSTPDGTAGTVDIAVNTAADGYAPVYDIVGSLNVYVDSTNTPTWFTVVASSSNLNSGRIQIDNIHCNGNATAGVFITHVINANSPRLPSGAFVTYDTSLLKWVIESTSGPLTSGATFNVRIEPQAMVVHLPSGDSKCNLLHNCPSEMMIDTSLSTNNPYAIIYVTPLGYYNSSGDTSSSAVIRLKYAAPYWYIEKGAGGSVPFVYGERYNVKVVGIGNSYVETTYQGQVDNGVATDNSPAFSSRWQYGNPTLPLVVTAVDNPASQFFNQYPPNEASVVGYPPYAVQYSWAIGSGLNAAKPGWQLVREDGGAVVHNDYVQLWGQPQPQ